MNIDSLLDEAAASRQPFIDSNHQGAFRLFNGFYEGLPELVLDIYARTLVIHDYAETPNPAFIQTVTEQVRSKFDWLQTGILKTRNSPADEDKRGRVIFGGTPDRKIREHGVWYAVDLTLNRDASFYLDTRNLRKWLLENSAEKTILNTFAYTGSLGVAAAAGKAVRVVQTDHNRQFLNLAKDSLSLNGLPIHKADFIAQDFFPTVARFKGAKQFFDSVIIDPPFFSSTSRGKVDLEHESERLINKVRPLIRDGGALIAINNAVFLSGKDYMHSLQNLCKDGYLGIREIIPVPQDCTGFKQMGNTITDPTPFNHSTKIAILDVKRKV